MIEQATSIQFESHEGDTLSIEFDDDERLYFTVEHGNEELACGLSVIQAKTLSKAIDLIVSEHEKCLT